MKPLPLVISRALAAPYPRGHRRSGPAIPPNMKERMAADEARAWSHSSLAGALWEAGIRYGLAAATAEKYLIEKDSNSITPKKDTMKKIIQSIEIESSNFVLIQGSAGSYEVIVWDTEEDSEGDDGSNAISRTTISEISEELSARADADNSL